MTAALTMTKVNFYPLNYDQAEARLQFACRLIEKAVSLGHRVHVHAPLLKDCRQLDEMLWQFKPTSFVTHEIVDASANMSVVNAIETEADKPANQHKEQVTLGTELPNAMFNDVLINLDQEPHPTPQQFKVINEVILADDQSRQNGRKAYRSYQGLNLEVTSHKI